MHVVLCSLKVTFGQSAAEHGEFPLTWKVGGSKVNFSRKLEKISKKVIALDFLHNVFPFRRIPGLALGLRIGKRGFGKMG